MTVRPLEPEALPALAPMLGRYPYHDYRHYPRFSAESRTRVLLHELEAARARGTALAVWAGEDAVGAGYVEPMPWDSAYFGVPMGKLALLPDPRVSALEILDPLLDALLEAAGRAGLRHLSVKLDCGHLDAVQALEGRGFRLMDCLLTYLCDCHRDPVPEVKRMARVREYQPEDRDAVVAIAERMYQDYAGRFTRDPWLPPGLVRRFYVEWVRNACAGQMADRLLVGERGGRVVSFLAYRRIPSVFESTGIRIAGQGISAVLPEGVGSYPSLLATAIAKDRVVTYDFAEFDTPIENTLPQRVFQKMGFRLVRSKYTLHRGAA